VRYNRAAMAIRRRSFDRLALVVFAVCVGALGWAAGARLTPATIVDYPFAEDQAVQDDLDRRFAPYYSNGREDGIVRDFFQDARNGVFVDVGAYDWQDGSNTYRLEQELGWSGLAIDAAPDYAEGYRLNRPRTTFISAFVDDEDGRPRTIYLGDLAQEASSDKALGWRRPLQRREVHGLSARLDSILAQQQIARMDFLSMDIELAEPGALRGFSIQRYRPRLVCIEMAAPVRQAILDYFARAGYVIVGKYLAIDRQNLYFTPLSD
jgi:FkbM family methyltransferase